MRAWLYLWYRYWPVNILFPNIILNLKKKMQKSCIPICKKKKSINKSVFLLQQLSISRLSLGPIYLHPFLNNFQLSVKNFLLHIFPPLFLCGPGWQRGSEGERYATPGEGPGPRPPAGPGVPPRLSDVWLVTETLPGAQGLSLSLQSVSAGRLMHRMSMGQ